MTGVMNGFLLMKGLAGFYLLLVGVFLYEGDWARALYWLGATMITGAVLWMR